MNSKFLSNTVSCKLHPHLDPTVWSGYPFNQIVDIYSVMRAEINQNMGRVLLIRELKTQKLI